MGNVMKRVDQIFKDTKAEHHRRAINGLARDTYAEVVEEDGFFVLKFRNIGGNHGKGQGRCRRRTAPRND